MKKLIVLITLTILNIIIIIILSKDTRIITNTENLDLTKTVEIGCGVLIVTICISAIIINVLGVKEGGKVILGILEKIHLVIQTMLFLFLVFLLLVHFLSLTEALIEIGMVKIEKYKHTPAEFKRIVEHVASMRSVKLDGLTDIQHKELQKCTTFQMVQEKIIRIKTEKALRIIWDEFVAHARIEDLIFLFIDWIHYWIFGRDR